MHCLVEREAKRAMFPPFFGLCVLKLSLKPDLFAHPSRLQACSQIYRNYHPSIELTKHRVSSQNFPSLTVVTCLLFTPSQLSLWIRGWV
jgi:hypothetical protein